MNQLKVKIKKHVHGDVWTEKEAVYVGVYALGHIVVLEGDPVYVPNENLIGLVNT